MYFVSGVSRGLGAAVVEALLAEGHAVTGIGRSHSINHPLFSFIKCDLNDTEAIETLELRIPKGRVTLINNAGIIGRIERLSEQNSIDLEEVLRVNTVAPMLLLRKIYDQIADKNEFSLVNISSGAANRAIPSWAAYCASKAALNMLSETFFLEEKELGYSPKVYAVAPGVIDTDMQVQIRSTDEHRFSSIGKFKALKEDGGLFSPEEAAKRLLHLIHIPYSGEIHYDLRSI